MSWAEMLDVLTDSDRRRNAVSQNPSTVENQALFLLRKEFSAARTGSQREKNFDLELYTPGEKVAVQVWNRKSKVYLGQIESFIELLNQDDSKHSSKGFLISTSGFTPSVYSYLREEKITNIRLVLLRNNTLIWDAERADVSAERGKVTYIGVFTSKGGVGKTTISAHLAGAFALNGYNVALLDLDKQQNLHKLLGDEVVIPSRDDPNGSIISILNHENWDESRFSDAKIVVCDCNPEFGANPVEFVRKFDYCLTPTTLNPLGINQSADVIKRSYDDIRRVNARAELFVLINNYYAAEGKRNTHLNDSLKAELKTLAELDNRFHYIDPEDTAIRFSKQLLYWGYHLFEGSKPQLAFRSVGGYSYPRLDFLKLVDYLEFQTEIESAKRSFFSA